MAVARSFAAGREQCFQQIERLTNSHSLRGAESLCRLLRYLAEHSLAHPPSTVKEYQIATEVFGRSGDFDPQEDSTVRVQVGRLRTKLSEYYAGEGAADPLLVRLPKGTYLPSFEWRSTDVTSISGTHIEPLPRPDTVEPRVQSWRTAVAVLSACLLVCLIWIAELLPGRKDAGPSVAASASSGNAALRAFWRPFISGPEEPYVIFSNAAFVGRPENGMRYYNPQRDSEATVRDHYTGVGEVLAVHQLDQAFETLGRRIRVKRGSLFTLDDAKNTDLIFVGSPSENLTLLDIPGTQNFVFHRVSSGPRQGDLAIVNQHPRAGEGASFLASRSEDPLTEDYAVVGLVPGLDPARFVLILAGTTTFGTQGAVDFVSNPESVAKLLAQLPGGGSREARPFEALVRVKVARGVPVETELVAVRPR